MIYYVTNKNLYICLQKSGLRYVILSKSPQFSNNFKLRTIIIVYAIRHSLRKIIMTKFDLAMMEPCHNDIAYHARQNDKVFPFSSRADVKLGL